MNELLLKAKEVCKEVLTLENLPAVVRGSFNPFKLQGVNQIAEKELFLEEIVRAKEEWLLAKANFELVGNLDLVDQAVFAMAAAEKKYVYLLKEAQKNNISSNYLYTSFGEARSQI